MGEPHPGDHDERALIERCRRGDLVAFEPLVDRYRDRVWRLAYHVLRDREEATEVAQETFIRAWRSLPAFRGQSAFYTWLFRIAVNLATDRVRQHAARRRALGGDPVPETGWDRAGVDRAPSPDNAAARLEERQRLTRALDALPEHHRTIIMLSDLDGLTYREIAEVLRIPMGTVMSRLHHARRRLRDLLAPLAVILALAGTLLAATPVAAQQVVRFGARVLLATDAPPGASTRPAPGPDERLAHVLPRLRQLFRYRDYTSLERYRAEVPVGSTQRWAVPGERQLEVTPEGVQGATVRLQVRLLRGSLSEVTTHIQAAAGSPAVIGGPRFADGVLIIIVWANSGPRDAP